MSKQVQHILIAAALTVLTFPDWYPEFGVTVDGSCAWLYNDLFAKNSAVLSLLIFPHGPFDFLQTPLPIGSNLEIALIFNTLLRFFFVWSGLKLAQALPAADRWKSWRYWGYAALMALWLQMNMMDVLLAATTGHLLLLAMTTRRNFWLAPAALLTVIGLLTKTIIGMPAAMMYAVTCWLIMVGNMRRGRPHGRLHGRPQGSPLRSSIWSYLRLSMWINARDWKNLALWLTVPVVVFVAVWLILFRSFTGFGDMILGTLYLTAGNSAAVCHYPANNWWLLGGFWLLFLLWPVLVKETRLVWWAMLLPVFAFWKYGISREDIWHIQTSWRFFGWVFGVLLLHLDRFKWLPYAIALAAWGCFYGNLKNSESGSPYDLRGWGLPHFWAWTAHFSEKKQAAAASIDQKIAGAVLPDSIRSIIGDRTIDIFPWHYAYAAANHFNVQPRRIPQSYAAYHPWLDGLDAAFFSGDAAPDFILFHLKPYNEGGQLMGLDDRYLLNDAPETLLQILDRYKVRARHPKYVLLEKTGNHFLGARKNIDFTADWQQNLPKENGFVRLSVQIEKTWTGRLKSIFYKDDPVFLDVRTGNSTRRIKIVPALAQSGIWLAPWLEAPSAANEPFRIPDHFEWVLPGGHTWHVDTTSMRLEWIGLNGASSFLPEYKTFQNTGETETVFETQIPEIITPEGYSSGWSSIIDSLPTGKRLVFEINAGIRSPKDNGCSNIVVAVTDEKGEMRHYESAEYCAAGVGENGWPVSLRSTLPGGLPKGCRIKIYVWNTGKQDVHLTYFKINKWQENAGF